MSWYHGVVQSFVVLKCCVQIGHLPYISPTTGILEKRMKKIQNVMMKYIFDKCMELTVANASVHSIH